MKKRLSELLGTNKRTSNKKNQYTDEYEEYYDEVEYDEESEDEEYYEEVEYDEESEDEEYYEEVEPDEESEEEEYYEEVEYGEEPEDEEYYEEAEYDEEPEDEEYYEEAEYDEELEDEEYDDDEFDVRYQPVQNETKAFSSRSHRKSGFADMCELLKEHMQNMKVFDYVLIAMTVLVLVVAGLAVKGFSDFNKTESQMGEIVPVGNQLSQIGIVGESGLLAMADAKANAGAMQEEITEVEPTENETENLENVKINVSFESVEKDLKIRFRNASTGEYIKGIEFEVTLTGPTGNKLVVKDEDKDGVIYINKLRAGTFTAVITSTDQFQFPTSGQKVTVKDKVEYVVVNVDDEVKKESQVNASIEDTAKVDAKEEEVVLKDTVEWVESSKQQIGNSDNYVKIDKSTIADPSLSTSAKSKSHKFAKLEVGLDAGTLTMQPGANATIKTTNAFTNVTEGNTTKNYEISWSSSDAGVVSVENGVLSAKKPGTATITCNVVEKVTTKEAVEESTEVETETEVESETEAETSISEEEYNTNYKDKDGAADWVQKTDGDNTVYVKKVPKKVTVKKKVKVNKPVSKDKTTETINEGSATCVVTVEAAKITGATFEIAKTADACSVGATLTVCPAKLIYTKTDGSTETVTSGFPAIVWSSSDTNIAKVDEKGVVTGVKKGQVTITGKIAGIKDKDNKELDIKASTTITINDAAALTVTLDSKERQVMVNDKTVLVATVTNYKSDKGVIWTTSDKNLATVDENGVVKMIKAGKVTITATTKEKDAVTGKQASASCVINIVTNAMTDYKTKLKDKNGNQVYIKDKDGKYVEAVFADYYTATEFFINQGGQYTYTGWQTIDGKTYYFDKNGKPVTGTQIIKGVTYNFGNDGSIQMSVNGATFGIDVSKWNGKIDWAQVKASGVNYAIIRCGYRGSSSGALIEDPLFRQNIQGASAAGIKVGIYFFSQAVNEVEAVKEASFAVELAKGHGLTYPIFIDTEPSGGRADGLDRGTRTAVVNAFCRTVNDAGYKAGIYASKTWFEQKLQAGSLSQYKIWLAQYAAKPTYSGKYDMWQYSHKGTISGIKGNVDLNYSYMGY